MPSPLAHAVMQGGISALTQTNSGARMSLPFFWQGLLGSALKGDVGVTDAMGIQGGMINNAYKQFDKWGRGDQTLAESALMSLSPVFIRNAYTGLVGWPTDGVKTGRGQVLLTPEDISIADSLKKVVGLSPRKTSDASTATYVQSLKATGSNEYLSGRKNEAANLRLEIFRAGQKGDTEKVQALQKEYRALYQETLEFMRKINGGVLSARQIDGLQSAIDQIYQQKKNPEKKRNAKEQ